MERPSTQIRWHANLKKTFGDLLPGEFFSDDKQMALFLKMEGDNAVNILTGKCSSWYPYIAITIHNVLLEVDKNNG